MTRHPSLGLRSVKGESNPGGPDAGDTIYVDFDGENRLGSAPSSSFDVTKEEMTDSVLQLEVAPSLSLAKGTLEWRNNKALTRSTQTQRMVDPPCSGSCANCVEHRPAPQQRTSVHA
jgi:hypothetical protein